jgi:polyhydroxybutyrate depolymerase
VCFGAGCTSGTTGSRASTRSSVNTTPITAKVESGSATTAARSPIQDHGRACDSPMVGGDRPVEVHVPPSYSCDVAAPLVILLHGYRASGVEQEAYFKVAKESDRRGFLYLAPDGMKDRVYIKFWNATDACCNFYGSTVDDSKYLSDLIADMIATYNVDVKRMYLIGHSNGGFMAHRMACEHVTRSPRSCLCRVRFGTTRRSVRQPHR